MPNRRKLNHLGIPASTGVNRISEGQQHLNHEDGDKPKTLKRYPLVVSEDIFVELEKLAAREQMSIAEVLRKFVKLGLTMTKLQGQPDTKVIIRQGKREQVLIVL